MPSLLRHLLSLELLLGLVLAVIVPAVEADTMRIPSAVAALLPVALCVLFLLRAPVSYRLLAVYSAVAAVGGFGYIVVRLLLLQDLSMGLSGYFLIAESAICALLFVQLKKQSSKDWFFQKT